jgi:hypothetical protein
VGAKLTWLARADGFAPMESSKRTFPFKQFIRTYKNSVIMNPFNGAECTCFPTRAHKLSLRNYGHVIEVVLGRIPSQFCDAVSKR